jgi:hypothetical protein
LYQIIIPINIYGELINQPKKAAYNASEMKKYCLSSGHIIIILRKELQ